MSAKSPIILALDTQDLDTAKSPWKNFPFQFNKFVNLDLQNWLGIFPEVRHKGVK